MVDRQYLLEERLFNIVKKLSLPAIMGMMVVSVNGLIDAVYLGNLLNASAFAGVSALFPLTLIVSSVNSFLSAGSSSLLSRVIGSGDKVTQRLILPNLLFLSIVSSIILMILGYIFADNLLRFIGIAGEVFQYAKDYLIIYLGGIFFSIYGLAANGLIRSEGRVKQAMNITIMAVVINLVLTPIFISTLGLGVAGAALSSVFSMLIYTTRTSLYFISGKATFEVGKFSLIYKKEIASKIASVGISAFSIQAANVIRQFIVLKTITSYGTTHDLIIYSAIFRLFSFVSVPILGILQPLQPVLGVNYGAMAYDRCKSAIQTFRSSAVLVALFLLLIMTVFSEFFFHLIIPDETILAADIKFMRIALLSLPFFPLASSTIIYFQATGNGKKAASFPLLKQALLFLPLLIILPYFFGVPGVYYTITIDNVIYGIALFFILRKEYLQLDNTKIPE